MAVEKSTGGFTPPPPGAPKEVSQPLTPQTQAAHLAKAQANEKDLKPLEAVIQAGKASAAAAQALTPKAVQTAPPAAPPTAPAGAGAPVPGDPVPISPAALPALPPDATPEEIADPVVNARPARGQPKPQADPGKQVTGGWGPQAAGMGFPAQYYALDGSEIAKLAGVLMRDLETQMAQDLRFHICMCYPQAAVRVTVEVAGSEPGAAINDVAFKLESRIATFTGTLMDTPDTPADALRDQAGLLKPYKRLVQTPTGNHIVDMET